MELWAESSAAHAMLANFKPQVPAAHAVKQAANPQHSLCNFQVASGGVQHHAEAESPALFRGMNP